MGKGRLEAFSDGVIAVIITIMVLEMKVPHGADPAALAPLVPIFLTYILSLFWLSLVPFVTGWMSENHYAPITVAAYGGVLLCSALAYTILVRTLLRHHEPDSVFARAVGSDLKGNLSLAAYIAAVPLAFVSVWISLATYAGVALAWLVPDRRFERLFAERK